MSKMYVVRKASGLLELRQERYRSLYEAGHEHPDDVCAVASTVEQMHEMVDKIWPDIDYSAVEPSQ